MRVFADLHHFDLYYSFQKLFEQRLKGQLYRPIGFEWYNEGFWFLSSEEVVKVGYLSDQSGDIERLLSQYPTFENHKEWARYGLELLRVGKICYQPNSSSFEINDKSKGITQRGILLSTFKNMDWDIIISSVPQHFSLFEKLRKRYCPKAKHIFHMGPGNLAWEVPQGAQNIMLHTPPPGGVDTINHVYYHQEFDTDIFIFDKPGKKKLIHSYVHYPESEELMNSISEIDESWQFKFLGKTLGSTSQMIVKTSILAQSIKDSLFIWHYKPGGESYGHILHNSFACGRPVLTKLSDYSNSMGGKLLEDMDTCIDIENRTPMQILKIMNSLVESGQYNEMCHRCYDRFCNVVDFDQEFENINLFLGRLQ